MMNSQIGEAPDDHGTAGPGDGDDRRRQPVAKGQGRIDDGQGGVPVTSEPGVIARYTVQDRFL